MRNTLLFQFKIATVTGVLFFSTLACADSSGQPDITFAPASAVSNQKTALPSPDTTGYVNYSGYHTVKPGSANKPTPWFRVEQAQAPYAPSGKPVTYMNESQHKAVIDYAMKNPQFRAFRNNPAYHHIEVFFLGGPTFSSLSNNNTVLITTYSNEYFANNQTNWGGMIGVGAGYVFPLAHHDMTISLDPAFYYNTSTTVQGIEYPFSPPGVPFNGGNPDSLNYQFNEQSDAFFMESHFVYTEYSWQPVVVVGLGVGMNDLSNYSEVPTDEHGSASPAPYFFRNQSNTDFAYELGLAVQHQIYANDKHDVSYTMSLGYRYFNFGEGQLAQSISQTSNQTLQVNSVYTQAILLSLSAAFG